MNPNDIPKGLAPELPLNPEDDPELQAIEAHEARPEELYPKAVPPTLTPKKLPIQKPTLQPPIIKKIIEVPQVIETPQTIASKMADAIANTPSTRTPFQFFIHKQVSKKSAVIVFVILTIVLVGIGVYVIAF